MERGLIQLYAGEYGLLRFIHDNFQGGISRESKAMDYLAVVKWQLRRVVKKPPSIKGIIKPLTDRGSNL